MPLQMDPAAAVGGSHAMPAIHRRLLESLERLIDVSRKALCRDRRSCREEQNEKGSRGEALHAVCNRLRRWMNPGDSGAPTRKEGSL